MKRFIFTAILIILLMPIYAYALTDTAEITEIAIQQEGEVFLGVNKTLKLNLSISPRKASKKVVIVWQSSDQRIATVENGVVKGISEGNAIITAYPENHPEKNACLPIHVVIPAEQIQVQDKKLIMPADIVWEQNPVVLPDNASIKEIKWESTNEKVATVDEFGTIHTVGSGVCTVTGTMQDGSGTKTQVTVVVKKHDYIIREPGEFDVDFDMTVEEEKEEKQKGKEKVVEKTERKVTIKNNCVQRKDDNTLIPVKAGSDTVHCPTYKNGKMVLNKGFTVFVTQEAIQETGAYPSDRDGIPLFRELPWGIMYREAKKLLAEQGFKTKYPATRNEHVWTHIEQNISFGVYVSTSNSLIFSSSSQNRDNLIANLNLTSFCEGDYYFASETPFENLALYVARMYRLPSHMQEKVNDNLYEWKVGNVRIELSKTDKYIKLSIANKEYENGTN